MKYAILILLALSSSCLARVIIIEKTSDGYRVLDYNNKDGSPSIARYGLLDDKTKILVILAPAATGLSKTADRAVLYTDEFGDIEKVDYQVSNGNTPERKVLVSKIVLQSVNPQVDAVRDEVNTKTGYIEKPKPVDASIVVEAVVEGAETPK